MAIAYATLGNGGTVVTPHVGKEIDDAAGRVLKEFDPGPQPPRPHRPDLPRRRSSKACTTPRRTAAAPPSRSSASFPIQVAGKTGTAQRPPHADQSWYVVAGALSEPAVSSPS